MDIAMGNISYFLLSTIFTPFIKTEGTTLYSEMPTLHNTHTQKQQKLFLLFFVFFAQ